ncbi:hypothetical protein FB451DRAFT_400324 [Mycena latifolia]|nr:hypothetical protein FB451DRAFT_400324 [Mycena latifolia]
MCAPTQSHRGGPPLVLAEILLLRTKLICHVLKVTLRSFIGLDPPTFVVHKGHKHAPNPANRGRQPEPELVEALGLDAAKAFKKDVKDGFKARRSERMDLCSYIGCHNSEPADGSHKFSRCKSASIQWSGKCCSFLAPERAKPPTGNCGTKPCVARPWISSPFPSPSPIRPLYPIRTNVSPLPPLSLKLSLWNGKDDGIGNLSDVRLVQNSIRHSAGTLRLPAPVDLDWTALQNRPCKRRVAAFRQPKKDCPLFVCRFP